MESSPRFSLIVPAYNESGLLPRLLASAEVAGNRYRGGREAIEIVVADNASTDETAEIAWRAGCQVVPVEKRCIAAARNGGARQARGEVLCFVDADCIVHPETFNVIEAGLTDDVIAGTTGVIPERWSLGLRCSYAMLMPLIWILGMDAGVVFCRRSDFDAVKGYNEDRLFAEDVEFLLALRGLGKRRSPPQKLARLKGSRTLTSARKWDKHGEWHLITNAIKHSFLMVARPSATEAFARRYWYEDR